MYTSDIDAIYSNIGDGNITSDMVRIVSSPRPQHLSILKLFTNIEELLCTLVLPFDKLESLGSVISSCDKLKTVSFMTFIPEPLEDVSLKKRKAVKFEHCCRAFKTYVPTIIRKLGSRMRYINMTITMMDAAENQFISVNMNQGVLYIGSNTRIPIASNKIFNALVACDSMQGLITDGDIEYDLDDVVSIPHLTIIARNESKSNPINESYLSDLIHLAVNVAVTYNSETFTEKYRYSEILFNGSSGSLKRINVIIPAYEIEDHIIWNPSLEEIHVLIADGYDVDEMKNILEKYSDRDIFYHVHYVRGDEDDGYWLSLKDTLHFGDVVFDDIVLSLMMKKIELK